MKITLKEVLEYEIRSTWWTKLVSWTWFQKIAGSYFAWKVGKKYKRYVEAMQRKQQHDARHTV